MSGYNASSTLAYLNACPQGLAPVLLGPRKSRPWEPAHPLGNGELARRRNSQKSSAQAPSKGSGRSFVIGVTGTATLLIEVLTGSLLGVMLVVYWFRQIFSAGRLAHCYRGG